MDSLTLLVSCALRIGAAQKPIGPSIWTARPTLISASDPIAGPSPEPVARWQPLIAEAAQRFGIPDAWIRSVMRIESGGRIVLDGMPTTSSAGAMGLMQVMPKTYAELRLRYGLGNDPYDPRDNILAGAAYLREMYDRFGYPGLFAAYNAGPGTLDAYLTQGFSLPSETLAYLSAISPQVHADTVIGSASTTAPPIAPAPSAPRSSTYISTTGNLFFFVTGTVAKPASRSGNTGFGTSSGSIFVKSTAIPAPTPRPNAGGLFVPTGAPSPSASPKS